MLACTLGEEQRGRPPAVVVQLCTAVTGLSSEDRSWQAIRLHLGLQSCEEGLQQYLERMTKLIDDAQADYSKVSVRWKRTVRVCPRRMTCLCGAETLLPPQASTQAKGKRSRPTLRSQTRSAAVSEGSESQASSTSHSETRASSGRQGSSASTGAVPAAGRPLEIWGLLHVQWPREHDMKWPGHMDCLSSYLTASAMQS